MSRLFFGGRCPQRKSKERTCWNDGFFYLAVFCRRFCIPAERNCSAGMPNLLLVAVGANNGRLRVEQKNAKKDEKKLSENLELTILFVNLQRNK